MVLTSTEMRALQERLLGNYSAYVRPVMAEQDVLEVNVSLHLVNLLALVSDDDFVLSGGDSLG